MVTHELKLELKNINSQNRAYIVVKQGDSARSVTFDIVSGDVPVSDAARKLRVKRPDGKLYEKTFTGNNVNLTSDMLAVAGTAICDVDVTMTDGTASTATFALVIKGSPSQTLPETSEDISAEGINEGFVLTANGSGGYEWRELPSGGTGGTIVPESAFTDANKNSTSKVPSMAAVSQVIGNKVDQGTVYTKAESDSKYALKGEGGSDSGSITLPYPVVNSIAEMTDVSKKYIYDGYVYSYEQNGSGGSTPTNLIYTSLATDDGVASGVGYVNDMAMGGSSATGAKAQSGFFATGYIPVTQNDVLNINQSGLQTANTNKRISLYNASKTRIQYYNCYGEISNSNMTLTGSGDSATLTILSSSVAFIRVSLPMPVTSATITRDGDVGTAEPTYGWVKKYPYVPRKEAGPLDKYAYQIDQCRQMGTRWDSTKSARTTDGILTFMHVSDTHGVNVTNSVEIANALSDSGHCSFVLHTGDIAKSTPNATEFTKFKGEIAESNIPYMFVAGNHDMAKGNTDFASAFASEVSKWNVTNNPSGKSYWYKDFSDARVRLIGFFDYENNGGADSPQYQAYSQAQVTWFVNALLSTPANYGVIVAKHNPVNVRGNLNNPFNTPSMIGSNVGQYWSDKNLLCDIVDAFMEGKTINKTWTQTKGMTESITVNTNFASKNSGTEFICFLDGHTHADGLSFLGGYPKQLEINIAADSWEDTRYSESVNEEGTLHQDVINYMSVDRNTGHIYIRRIGNDFSATAKRKDFTIVDYRNPSSGSESSGSGTDGRVDDLAQNTGDYGFRKIYSQTFDEVATANLSVDIPNNYRHVMIHLESTTDEVIGSDFSEFQFLFNNKKDNGGSTSARVYAGKYKTVFATADIDGDVLIVKSRGSSTGYSHTGHVDGYNLGVADNITPTDASYIYKINYNVKMPAGSIVRVYAK